MKPRCAASPKRSSRALKDEEAEAIRQGRTVRMSRAEWQALPLIAAGPRQEGDVARALHGEGWLAACHDGVWVEYPVVYV